MPGRRMALGAALAVGVAGDIMLRASPWGLGFSVWVALTAAIAFAIQRDGRRGLDPAVAAFLAAATLFGTGVAFRDSPELRIWNVLGVLIALGMALIAGRGLPLAAASVARYAAAAVSAALAAVSAPVVAGVERTRRPGGGNAGLMLRFLLASAIAVPLVLLFGTLLMSADPVFDHLVRSLFGIDFTLVASHGAVIAVLSWMAAGYGLALLQRRSEPADTTPPWLPALGLVEIGVPMIALTVLFVAFLGVQAGYLFGGEALVQTTVGLSVAEYARRGFFELVTASGLTIPVVVGADVLLGDGDPRAVRWFRWIAWTQIACVALLLVSALGRLRIYTDAYGLTLDRVLAASVMVWIGLTLGWFAVTVLRGRRSRFPLGVVVAGLAVLAVVDTINPEAVVARVNVQRAVAGAELDVQYLSRLSADAVPTLVTRADRLPHDIRTQLLGALTARWIRPDRGGWRSWNLGFARAQAALAHHAGPVPR